jgi:hypothetical protein
MAEVVAAVVTVVKAVLASEVVKKIVVTIAVNALARMLQPKSKDTSADRSSRFSKRRDSSPYRDVILGTALTGGTFIDAIAYSTDNMFYAEIIKLADHECDGLVGVYAGGRQLTINGDGSVQEYIEGSTPRMWIYFQAGAWGETTHSEVLTAFGGRYTANDRGRGVCRVVLKCDMRSDKLFPSRSPPDLTFAVRGAKIYSPRLDTSLGGSHVWGNYGTYAWTDNLADIAYNVARGIFVYGGASPERLAGGSYDSEELPLAQWAAESSACEVLVPLKAGGSERRYRGGLLFSTNEELEGILADLAAGAAGFMLDLGGTLIFQAGVARTPVATLTDADFIAGKLRRTWRQAARERFNTITGRFTDPALRYTQNTLPIRRSTSDITADNNEERVETMNLGVVQSQTQGQRVMEIRRRSNRLNAMFQVELPPRWQHLEAGDWVTYTSARRGWTKTFVLLPSELKTTNEDMLVSTIAMVEVSSSVYTWTPASDELDVINPATVGPGSVPNATLAGFTAVSSPNSGASDSVPAILVNWTIPDDPTINTVAVDYKRPAALTWLTQSFDAKLGTGQLTGLASGSWQVRARPITQPLRDATATSTITVTTGSLVSGEASTIGPQAANLVPGSGPIYRPDRPAIAWMGEPENVRWTVVETGNVGLGVARWNYNINPSIASDPLMSPLIAIEGGAVISAQAQLFRLGTWTTGDIGAAINVYDASEVQIGSPIMIGWASAGVPVSGYAGCFAVKNEGITLPGGAAFIRTVYDVVSATGTGSGGASRIKVNRGPICTMYSEEATNSWTFGSEIGRDFRLPDGNLAPVERVDNIFSPRTDGVTAITVQQDFAGNALPGQLDRTFQIRRFNGTTDVTSTTTFSVTMTGGTATITSGGLLQITSTVGGRITVTTVRDGLTISHIIEVTAINAALPATGGGGARNAVDTTIDPASTGSLVTCGGPITVRAGAAGQIVFGASLAYTTSSTSNSTAGARIRYRVGAGAWTWAAAEVTGSAANSGFAYEQGDIDAGTAVTGLVNGTDYECELQCRRATGSGTLYFYGSFAAEAS